MEGVEIKEEKKEEKVMAADVKPRVREKKAAKPKKDAAKAQFMKDCNARRKNAQIKGEAYSKEEIAKYS